MLLKSANEMIQAPQSHTKKYRQTTRFPNQSKKVNAPCGVCGTELAANLTEKICTESTMGSQAHNK
eukprot:scaffold7167_cov165-Amphora_coffeaeformis.AAC.6